MIVKLTQNKSGSHLAFIPIYHVKGIPVFGTGSFSMHYQPCMNLCDFFCSLFLSSVLEKMVTVNVFEKTLEYKEVFLTIMS